MLLLAVTGKIEPAGCQSNEKTCLSSSNFILSVCKYEFKIN
jgi:hypothetical protein